MITTIIPRFQRTTIPKDTETKYADEYNKMDWGKEVAETEEAYTKHLNELLLLEITGLA